jgi:hypothetical protein
MCNCVSKTTLCLITSKGHSKVLRQCLHTLTTYMYNTCRTQVAGPIVVNSYYDKGNLVQSQSCSSPMLQLRSCRMMIASNFGVFL